MSFDPCTQWDGTREIIGKSKSFHQTTPLSPEQQRMFIAKAKGQDKKIWSMVKAMGSATPRQIQERQPGMLLSSIRRALTNLTDQGLLRKGECVMNQLNRPEHQWTT